MPLRALLRVVGGWDVRNTRRRSSVSAVVAGKIVMTDLVYASLLCGMYVL